MKLLKVDSVDQARSKLLTCVHSWGTACETKHLTKALGDTLANDIFAVEDLPAFRRSTVDGYAVVSKDTGAAGESIPVFLTVKERVMMGAVASATIHSGECAEVPTGGMIPDGADAVVMVEYAEPFGANSVALYHGVANGENVVQIGEEVRKGTPLLRRGKRILPQDIGALAAAGITEVSVFTPLKMTILSTGDELVAPDQMPHPGQIRDVNTYALCALAEKSGFNVLHTAVIPDNEGALAQAVSAAMKTSDIVAVSGGSSQGEKDATHAVFDRVASPGVFTHGMAIKPGKPTILGCDASSQTLLVGLPGHPVSAMMVFEILLAWLWREMTRGVAPPVIPARVSCNVASSPGKLTCWPAKLEWVANEFTAVPVFGKSGLITTLTQADGYFVVDQDREGLATGEMVLVHLF